MKVKSVQVTSILVVMSLVMFGLAQPAHALFPTSANPTGLIVPLYQTVSSGTWGTLLNFAESYGNVPIIAIMNPESGPGSSYSSSYASGVVSLESAGITMLGYVPTNFGVDNITYVESMIMQYHEWYTVNGIFFDQMASGVSYEAYYAELAGYATALGFSITFGNPGNPVPSGYIGGVNVLNIYEGSGLPSVSTIASETSSGTRNNFAVIAYDISDPSDSYIKSLSPYVSWVYFTNGSGGNPYLGLSSFLSTLMYQMSDMDASTVAGNLVVTAESTSGVAINGLYTTIQAPNGTYVYTGFTPVSFYGIQGVGYLVEIQDYGPYNFIKWTTGNTNQISVDQPYYYTPVIAEFTT
jgi:Spherulation-specific family 4